MADGANVILDWHEVGGNRQALYEPLLSEDLAEAEMEYHADYIQSIIHTQHPDGRYIIYIYIYIYIYVAPFEAADRGHGDRRGLV